MREFFELVNEYPWTTFWLFVAIMAILGEFVSIFAAIRGDK